jgi:hypothetical protein
MPLTATMPISNIEPTPINAEADYPNVDRQQLLRIRLEYRLKFIM